MQDSSVVTGRDKETKKTARGMVKRTPVEQFGPGKSIEHPAGVVSQFDEAHDDVVSFRVRGGRGLRALLGQSSSGQTAG